MYILRRALVLVIRGLVLVESSEYNSFRSSIEGFLASNNTYTNNYTIAYKQAKPPLSLAIDHLASSQSPGDSELDVLAHLLLAEAVTALNPSVGAEMAKAASATLGKSPTPTVAKMLQRLELLLMSHDNCVIPESLDLVIVFCNENLDWVRDLFPARNSVNVHIMSKCGNFNHVESLLSEYASSVFVELPNRGQESIGYTEYIVNYANASAASHALLVHGDPFSHTNNVYLKFLVRTFFNGYLAEVPFIHLSNRRFLTGSSFCLRDLQLNAMGFVDPVIGSYCCSQFLVSKTRLLAAVPVAQKLHGFLNGNEDGLKCSQKRIDGHRPGHHISMSLENLWPRVLGEDPVLPVRQHDDRLPLLLRNEMLTQDDLSLLSYFDSLNL